LQGNDASCLLACLSLCFLLCYVLAKANSSLLEAIALVASLFDLFELLVFVLPEAKVSPNFDAKVSPNFDGNNCIELDQF
jgi:hypothetical protein